MTEQTTPIQDNLDEVVEEEIDFIALEKTL